MTLLDLATAIFGFGGLIVLVGLCGWLGYGVVRDIIDRVKKKKNNEKGDG